MTSKASKDVKWLFKVHHLCTVLLYVVFQLCLFMNLYVLLSREDTIFYLRIYHSIIALLMFCCGIVEMEFLIRTRNLPKLEEPHAIPGPALIGAVALTIGIVLGYLYFIIFNYAFQNCDKLVDAIYTSELWLESCYDILMAAFSGLSLVYILQRRYYGAINSNLDKIGRLFINITFSVVWVKVVVYKGYLSHQELCQRKELESYWCPVMRRNYECTPSDDLHGTQKMWYYINKGILSSSIISCASEFFPVLLVAHWLACGGAEEKAEDIERRRQLRQGVRALMKEFLKDISRVYTATTDMNVPPLKISSHLVLLLWILTPLASLACAIRWLVYFYWTIDFDYLMDIHWITNDIVSLVAIVLQLFFFISVYAFTWYLTDERLDAHHKAHARGDISILFGCCLVLFVKLILQSVEVEFQRKDGFVTLGDAIIATICYVAVQASQWLQYFSVRRILAMSDRDCRATKKFLPFAALGGLLMAWIHFGITFFDTSLIKYQLTDEHFDFSQTTLVCMIFTQTIFPADYLFAFTVSGCYLELLQRYLNMGFFQLGSPRLSVSHSHNHEEAHENSKRFEHGPNIATMMHAANIMYRKRMESDFETTTTASCERASLSGVKEE
ncbi:hypothetical protein Y032_0428g1299 [Ancylostoma ceylanicum]|uniref:Uncharacterized protein n=2 Tax=Ancylostoma ceylanicum TaxID=53326 RepID=A0A016X1Q3_9BILA|nr:hypothetical protein Y032_0428g1299 [Ancylostoma ceylanicum]